MVRRSLLAVASLLGGCGASVEEGPTLCGGLEIELRVRTLSPRAPRSFEPPASSVVVDDARSGCVIADGDAARFAKPTVARAPNRVTVAFRVRGPGLLPSLPLDYDMRFSSIERPFFGISALTEEWRSSLPPLTTKTSPVLVIVSESDDHERCGGLDGYAISVLEHPSAVVRYLSAEPPYLPVPDASTTTASGFATIEGLPLGSRFTLSGTRDRCRSADSVYTVAETIALAGVVAQFN